MERSRKILIERLFSNESDKNTIEFQPDLIGVFNEGLAFFLTVTSTSCLCDFYCYYQNMFFIIACMVPRNPHFLCYYFEFKKKIAHQ